MPAEVVVVPPGNGRQPPWRVQSLGEAHDWLRASRKRKWLEWGWEGEDQMWGTEI